MVGIVDLDYAGLPLGDVRDDRDVAIGNSNLKVGRLIAPVNDRVLTDDSE
jgi:hypothetical protein